MVGGQMGLRFSAPGRSCDEALAIGSWRGRTDDLTALLTHPRAHTVRSNPARFLEGAEEEGAVNLERRRAAVMCGKSADVGGSDAAAGRDARRSTPS